MLSFIPLSFTLLVHSAFAFCSAHALSSPGLHMHDEQMSAFQTEASFLKPFESQMTINPGLGSMDLMKHRSPEIPQSHLKNLMSQEVPKTSAFLLEASFLKPCESQTMISPNREAMNLVKDEMLSVESSASYAAALVVVISMMIFAVVRASHQSTTITKGRWKLMTPFPFILSRLILFAFLTSHSCVLGYDYVRIRGRHLAWTQRGIDIDGISNDNSGSSVSVNDNGGVVAIGAPTNGRVSVVSWNGTTYNQRGSAISRSVAGQSFGTSVSMSYNGSVLAIGAPSPSASVSNVSVYYWHSNNYTQRGSNIVGDTSDKTGESVSLSGDGLVLAVGSPGYSNDKGRVRVYSWNGTAHVQRTIGNQLEVVGSNNDFLGNSVSVSYDGAVLAIGIYKNDGPDVGLVRVYRLEGTNYIQRGVDIIGEANNDESGTSVSLSGDGLVLAIGAPKNNGNGTGGNVDKGHVRVWSWNGTAHVKRGLDIDGEFFGDYSGCSVSLSYRGFVLAIGAYNNRGNGTVSNYNPGHVRVFTWNGTSYIQQGSDIDGEAHEDEFGKSVSLSANGKVLGVGAPKNDGNGTSSGHVRMYDLDVTEFQPSNNPSDSPSLSSNPSETPSSDPSSNPSETPSSDPSSNPSDSPSVSSNPSETPSSDPSSNPSDTPSSDPSSNPSDSPSVSSNPSGNPSSDPSSNPSDSPSVSSNPSGNPSSDPSSNPSNTPSVSSNPSETPSSDPSSNPSDTPSVSSNPSGTPSSNPSPSCNVLSPILPETVFVNASVGAPENNGKLSVNASNPFSIQWSTTCKNSTVLNSTTTTPTLLILAGTPSHLCEVSVSGCGEKSNGMIVVVNPAAGSITGGGWIQSPAGAYYDDRNLTGKASFTFISAYKKGMSVPLGDTVFKFETAGLHFKSTSYEWLVVTGSNCAKYKGKGAVNGVAQEHGFILTACDKGEGVGTKDTFRIQINGVYDNLMNMTDEVSYNGTVISGGNIQVKQSIMK